MAITLDGTTGITTPGVVDTGTLSATTITGTSFQGIIGNVTPSTGAFTTLSATKATGGDAATFTNAAALNKTGYIYTDNRYVGLFTSANGGGSGFASDTSVPNAYIQVGGAAIVTAITTGAAVTGLLNISAATSGQIQFPATQNASANANTLDDYEEGTYTPTVGSMTTTGTPVYVGAYTKIGRQVVISICGTNQTTTTYAATANSTNFTVPFTSLNNGTYAKFVGGWSVWNAVAGGFVHVQNGSTQADFVTSMTSTNGFSATVTYFV